MGKLDRRPNSSKLDRPVRPSPSPCHHFDVININPDNCFVCDRPFVKPQRARIKSRKEEADASTPKKKAKKHQIPIKVYIGERNGQPLYRHWHCDCNSPQWKKKFAGCTSLFSTQRIA